ncbi:cytochrome P450 [Saccharata proteae CBS 121410]|uniref:Cytochrome P450 n=1 Tax=Saccharata proteae CBS 121410 TaxID=1314787 RepID=A0A9P4HVH7_9PEZI|nr:cytochrome P450 [Saccharata proteae CBS 121410]
MIDITSLSPSVLALCAAGAFITLYPLALIIYNLTLHPLRSYPGPISAAATVLPNVLSRLSGRQPVWLASLHEQYGDVVRVGPNELSYIKGQAWKDITGFRINGRGNLSKDHRFLGQDVVGDNSIIRAGDEDHSRQRRLLSHAFSDKALRDQEPLIRKYADLLITRLQEVSSTTGSPINIVAWLNYCTFDIMADLTYSEPLHQLSSSSYSPWVAAIFNSIKAGTTINVMNTYLPLFSSITRQFIPAYLIENREMHGQNSLDRITKRLDPETVPHEGDIMSFVLKHNNNKDKAMTLPEMQANSSLLMVAGTETTATLLSGLSFLLMKNPEKMEKLKREIRDGFKTPEEMDMNGLGRLPYLQACVEEAFRLYPPVPSGLSRITGPEGDVICDRFVPAKTVVYVTQWAAYTNSRNWHKADEFVPERWLPDADPVFANDEKFVLQPFSYGPRNCVGKNLALHEMRIIFANLLWHFDLHLEPECEKWNEQNIFVLWEKHPLMTRLTPVSHTAA